MLFLLLRVAKKAQSPCQQATDTILHPSPIAPFHMSATASHKAHAAGESTSHQKPFDLTISFAAGGWFQMFHFGVCKAMVDSGYLDRLEKEGKRVRFCGSSAGSLAAASLASGCHMHDEMRDFAVICGEHYRSSLWHFMCMREYLVASIHRFGDRMMETDEKRERTLNGMREGRLEVYTTTLPLLRPKCITEFTDLADIEESLIASCCLSPVVGFPFPLRKTGEWVCDGGIRAFQPRNGEARTLTVSPFYFTSADIRPPTAVPVWWGLFPPAKAQHEDLFAIGYNACLEYLVTSGQVPKEMSTLLKTRNVQVSDAARRTGGPARIALDFVVTSFYVVMLRPLAIVAIYFEMLLVGLILLAIIASNVLRGKSLDATPVYETFRNMVSLRVFLRLLLSSRIPINESRLVKRSTMYRACQPLVFDSGRGVREKPKDAANGSSGPGGGSAKKKRFVVDAHWNVHQRWNELRRTGGAGLWGRPESQPKVLAFDDESSVEKQSLRQ